ncbi:30S ribosome-binding factor RbfA [Salinisphaera sp. LB1]|uniref:30S ribosome-binding factor RbfA n=1 Tax=Salinisphaera sp. LB1 TaxID=2183911 RepID=UPI000D70709A|nr:30S ribosome-binding factor RbfA [Salinisphaera sp. LB1]AWN17593.1 Ribosome-binding factor A [Salinisphaera sp. LB1]
MGREFSRHQRVREELKRELGVLIATQVKDPRVTFVTITDVEVSPDLKYAKVFVSNFDVTAPAEKSAEAIAGLRAARGFLKKHLGQRLRLRVMPDLRFIEDATEREAQRLDQIISGAVREDRDNAESTAREDDTADPDRGAS